MNLNHTDSVVWQWPLNRVAYWTETKHEKQKSLNTKVTSLLGNVPSKTILNEKQKKSMKIVLHKLLFFYLHSMLEVIQKNSLLNKKTS